MQLDKLQGSFESLAHTLGGGTPCATPGDSVQHAATVPQDQETAAAAAASCGPDATATTQLLDQVEEDLLSYWLLRGGGRKEGNA